MLRRSIYLAGLGWVLALTTSAPAAVLARFGDPTGCAPLLHLSPDGYLTAPPSTVIH